jgi:hypothetical protein
MENRICIDCKVPFDALAEGLWVICGQCVKERDKSLITELIAAWSGMIAVCIDPETKVQMTTRRNELIIELQGI